MSSTPSPGEMPGYLATNKGTNEQKHCSMLNHFEKMTGLKKFWLKNTRENQTYRYVKVERHHVHTFWTTTVEHWQGLQFEVFSVFHVSKFSISQEMDMKRILSRLILISFLKHFFFRNLSCQTWVVANMCI